jgi:hypothetical protein
MRRQGVRRPFRSFGSTGRRNNGASVGSVVNAQIVMESQQAEACPRSPGRRQRSRSLRASCRAPIGNCIDEALILLGVRTVGDGKGLPMGCGRERSRANVRHPNLNRSQSLPAQAIPSCRCARTRNHVGPGGPASSVPARGFRQSVALNARPSKPAGNQDRGGCQKECVSTFL